MTSIDLPPKVHFAFTAAIETSEVKTLKSFTEATSSPQAKYWLKACQTEVDSLCKNKAWELFKLPEDATTVKGKWVFKVKLDKNSGIARYKARWVARDFTQIAGIDYDETYAAVAKPVSIHMLMAIVAHYDLECKQYDIITAFLNAMIGDRKIYVEQPHGFEVDNHNNNNNNSQPLVCLLLRALYGLKQSLLLWYEELTKFLKSLGFAALCGDACVFQHAYTQAIIVIYVDDLVLMALKTAIINDFCRVAKESL
jgi:hypothetical protein